MDYSIQLYSVRDHMEKDFKGTLKKIAEIGYSAVEFAGFYGNSAEEVNEIIKETGLKISGTHSPFDELVANYEETVKFHKLIGNTNYIVPAYDLTSQEKIDCFVKKANPIIEKLAADGIKLSFHNHTRELVEGIDGSIAFDQLIHRTNINFEVDTFWAFVATNKPIEILDTVKERLSFVHMRDGSKQGVGAPLGMGEAPVQSIYKYAKENNVPIVVENDANGMDSIESAKICVEYLKTL